MPAFTTAQITRFKEEAEDQFNLKFNCIVDRYAIPVISGTATYVLPSYIINIRRVTYKGWKLDPLTQRELRTSFLNGTQSGRPYWYIFNNIGQLKIQLMPVPQENVASVTTGLFGSNIINAVIVEHYRTPDYATFILPTFLRRRLVKAFVMKRCFEVDNKGGNLKAAKYWTEKWDALIEMYGNALDDLITKPRNLITAPSANTFGFTPPAPLLPSQYLNAYVED